MNHAGIREGGKEGWEGGRGTEVGGREVGARWEEEGMWGGGGGEEGRGVGGRGIRMNHGTSPWGEFHFVTAQSAHMHTAGSFHYMDFLWQVMERHDMDLKAKKDLIRLVAEQRRRHKRALKNPSEFLPFGEHSRGLTIPDLNLLPHPSFKMQETAVLGGAGTSTTASSSSKPPLDVSGRAPAARVAGTELHVSAAANESSEDVSKQHSENHTSLHVVDPKTIYADVRRIQREMEMLFRCKYELTGIKDYLKQLQMVTRGGMSVDELMSIDDFVAAARERRFDAEHAGDTDVPMDVAILAVGKYSHTRPGGPSPFGGGKEQSTSTKEREIGPGITATYALKRPFPLKKARIMRTMKKRRKSVAKTKSVANLLGDDGADGKVAQSWHRPEQFI